MWSAVRSEQRFPWGLVPETPTARRCLGPPTPSWSPRRSRRSRRSSPSSSSATATSMRALGAAGAGELGGLVEQVVQLRVLLEVRGLEVVGPQHPQVVLDQLGALLLDDDRAGPEVGVVVAVVLLDDGLDRLGLDPGLGGVVDAARQVAVGADRRRWARTAMRASRSFRRRSGMSCDTTRSMPARTQVAPSGQGLGAPVRRRVGASCRVRGASMEPTLRDGDRLLVRYGAPPAPATGVVVLALPGRRPAGGQAGRAPRTPDGLVGRARQPAPRASTRGPSGAVAGRRRRGAGRAPGCGHRGASAAARPCDTMAARATTVGSVRRDSH